MSSLPQLPSSLKLLQILMSFKWAKPHSSLMQFFLQRSISLKLVPKLTFSFLLEIKMYDELEAGESAFLHWDFFGLVRTHHSRQLGVLPNHTGIRALFSLALQPGRSLTDIKTSEMLTSTQNWTWVYFSSVTALGLKHFAAKTCTEQMSPLVWWCVT